LFASFVADGNVIVESYVEMVPKGSSQELSKILELRGILKPGPFLERYALLKEAAQAKQDKGETKK
jgi:hypothetical protein